MIRRWGVALSAVIFHFLLQFLPNEAIVQKEMSHDVTNIPTESLVELHNDFRRKVSSSNMRKMFWNEALAETARKHVKQCVFSHSNLNLRGKAGENIWGGKVLNFTNALETWFQTNENRCDCSTSYMPCCWAYTTLMWSKTWQLGCAAVECDEIHKRTWKYLLVCHYWPAANTPHQTVWGQRAFFVGQPCSRCPEEAASCDNKLCKIGPQTTTRKTLQVTPKPLIFQNIPEKVTPVKFGFFIRRIPPDWNFLLAEHNKYRSIIAKQYNVPNMHRLDWDRNLAFTAQQHADRCMFGHSSNRQRYNAAENIWAGGRANAVANAVWMWYDEVNDARCGCQHAYKHCCGHYTQVVWAATFRVGCGFAECTQMRDVPSRRWRFVLVCHYKPRGNIIHNGRKVLAFRSGRSPNQLCSRCPHAEDTCFDGLCG